MTSCQDLSSFMRHWRRGLGQVVASWGHGRCHLSHIRCSIYGLNSNWKELDSNQALIGTSHIGSPLPNLLRAVSLFGRVLIRWESNVSSRPVRSLRRDLRLTIKYALLDQVLGLGPVCYLFVQAVCAHVFLELLLVALQRRGCGRVWKNVPCHSTSCQQSLMSSDVDWPSYVRPAPRGLVCSPAPSSGCR